MVNIYELEQYIKNYMLKENVPGLAVSIISKGEVIYTRGFGVTSIENGGAPVSPQTLFPFCSITKTLVSTAVMRLVEDGLLDLDLPVKEYVEWITFSKKGVEEQITLRMLMSHTSGLPKDSLPAGQRDPEGLERFVREQLPAYQLVASPGKVHSYCNAGFALIGYIIQKISGKLFTDLMDELVFRPLEMKHTTFDPIVAMTYSFAFPHDISEKGALNVNHSFPANIAMYPTRGVFSTVLDIANFVIMHLQQGRFQSYQLLTPQSIKEMHTPQVDLYTLYEGKYGFAFTIRPSNGGVHSVGHSGEQNNHCAKLLMFPERNLGFVFAMNTLTNYHRLVSALADRLIGAATSSTTPPRPYEPERSLWPLFVGTYIGARVGLAVISIVENQLTLTLNNQVIALQARSTHLYFGFRSVGSKPTSIGFVSNKDEQIQYLMINMWPCERTKIDKDFPSDPTIWGNYSGIYKSGDDPDIITLRVEGSQLFLHSLQRSKIEIPCITLDSARFTSNIGIIEFNKTNDGETSFILQGVHLFKKLTSCK